MGAGLLAACVAFSPVSRAGWTAVAMVPAWWLVARWTARMWSRPSARWIGIRGLSVLVIAMAGWSCVDYLIHERGRAAMPLGHHNLLAAWLLPLLPPAVALWQGPARGDRGLAIGAGCAGIAAMLASGSLAGLLCLVGVGGLWVLQGVIQNLHGAKERPWLYLGSAVAGLVGLWTLQGSRLMAVISGADASTSARWTYLEAAWVGFLERPFWGWGPGSTAWTASIHLKPVAGVHPPSQVVADFHNLPLQLLYELGLFGCLGLALVLSLGLRPVRAEPRGPSRAAGWGLIAVGLFSVSGFLLSVPALPMACLVVWVLWLSRSQQDIERPAVGYRPTIVAAILMVATIIWQIPRDRAHLLYDRAIRSENEAAQLLSKTRALDPHLPLYGWRRALMEADPDEAALSAGQAMGLAAFWLTSGDLAADPMTATVAWRRAAALDPLGASAAFRLANGDENRECRITRAMLALAAEPLLVAAQWHDESTWIAAVDELAGRTDLDVYWRERLIDLAGKRTVGNATIGMGLKVDFQPSESLSLFAFRRVPWPAVVTRFELDADLARQVDLLPIPPPRGLLAEMCK